MLDNTPTSAAFNVVFCLSHNSCESCAVCDVQRCVILLVSAQKCLKVVKRGGEFFVYNLCVNLSLTLFLIGQTEGIPALACFAIP